MTDRITPCCTVVGHVDVGKTSLLDYMRGTNTLEAQGITQQIGCTKYSRERLEYLMGEKMRTKLKIDQMLWIDTPGHECFDMIRLIGMRCTDIVIIIICIQK
jgi:translation initiation factor 5B